MKASELRVSNWIKLFLGLSDNVPEYLELQINGVMVQNEEEYILLRNTWTKLENNIEPIELTEEKLMKFGFEKCLNGYWCEKELLNVKISKHSVIEIYLSGSDTDLALNGIQFVHQLQNLYFALANEELTIKPIQKH